MVKAQGGINATAVRRIRQAVANDHGIGHGFGGELEVLARGGKPDAFSAGGFPFNGVGVGSGSQASPGAGHVLRFVGGPGDQGTRNGVKRLSEMHGSEQDKEKGELAEPFRVS